MPTVTQKVDTMTKAEAKPTAVVGAMDAFLQNLVEATGDATMGAQQLRLLTSLYLAGGGLNQIDLPKYTGVERSANSRNIARLGEGQFVENRTTGVKRHEPGLGLVEGYEEPTDRRFKMVRLTPKGRAIVEAAARGASSRLG
jgi:DNA-binding MarR family transcriptional regulator